MLLLLAGCREHDLLRCHFGEERTIAETGGGGFHGVRHLGERLLWSAREGLFLHEGDGVERLGPPCDGGFDATSAAGVDWVVCARRPMPAAAKTGGLSAWRLQGEERERVALDGAVGEESQGVAIALHEGRLVVAWHEGSPKAFHVWRQDLDPQTLEALTEPERLSDPRFAAGAPTLSAGERLAIVWGEHWADREGRHRVSGHVVVSVDGGAPRTLVEVEDLRPSPVIARDGKGPLLLFRDQRAPLDYPSLFAHRLTTDLRLHGGLRLLGRADEGGPIRTFGCAIDGAPTQVAVVARSWGADDALVAAHLLDDELAERFHELQVYEWGGQLVLGDGVCEDDSLELLVAERVVPASDDAKRRTARLVTLPARCGAGPYPRSGED